MDTFRLDLRYGLRMLARNPGFTAVAILTLALGIGGTTAIFSFVNAVVVRPLPYKESDRLALVFAQPTNPGPFRITAVTPGDFLDWQAQNEVFEEMAAFSGGTYSLTGAGDPERLSAATVTSRFFDTLGVAPILGRTFLADEDRSGADQVAVISERLWRRRFGSDPTVVGKPILLDSKPVTVIGVMPGDFTFPLDIFRFPGARAWPLIEIWTPLVLQPGYRANATLQVFARLKTGMTFEAARTGMAVVAAQVANQLGRNRAFEVGIEPLHDRIVREVRPLLLVFAGAVGFVLLIACANVANLLVARAATRHKEVAVRTALGSGRWRLARQFLTESVLLGVIGGAAGVFVALWGVDVASSIIPPGSLPRLAEIGLDMQALAFSIVVSVAAGLLFGLAPAMHSAGTDVNATLKEAATTGTPRSRTLDVLVVSQVALAFVLLVGAALMMRSFLRLTSVDPGFQPQRTLTLSVTLPETGYATATQMSAFGAAVLERIASAPDVVHAGAVNWLPLGGSLLSGDFLVEAPAQMPPDVIAAKPAVSPEYFAALGIPILRGRAFTASDGERSAGVAIVTEGLARQVWPGEDPIGKRLKLGFGRPDDQPWLSIVGVVAEIKQNTLGEKSPLAVYVPLTQAPRPFLLRSLTFVIRTAADPLNIAATARRHINEIDPNLPIDRIETMEAIVASSVSEPRFRTLVLTAFAGTALALVAAGILGVLAYSVTRRTREIGVRMALGAQRVDVLSLVVRHALTLTMAGVTLGGLAALALTRLLARFLFEVQPTDPVAFVTASLLLVGVALVASYVPARRAATVDPVIALRAE